MFFGRHSLSLVWFAAELARLFRYRIAKHSPSSRPAFNFSFYSIGRTGLSEGLSFYNFYASTTADREQMGRGGSASGS